MSDVLTMRPGARAGQIILLVELDLVDEPSAVIDLLKAKGYTPTIHHCTFKTGDRPVAVLKDERFDPSQEIDDEYLMDEWIELGALVNREAVRLWRGHPSRKTMAIAV